VTRYLTYFAVTLLLFTSCKKARPIQSIPIKLYDLKRIERFQIWTGFYYRSCFLCNPTTYSQENIRDTFGFLYISDSLVQYIYKPANYASNEDLKLVHVDTPNAIFTYTFGTGAKGEYRNLIYFYRLDSVSYERSYTNMGSQYGFEVTSKL